MRSGRVDDPTSVTPRVPSVDPNNCTLFETAFHPQFARSVNVKFASLLVRTLRSTTVSLEILQSRSSIFCGAPSWCKVLPPVVLVCCCHSGAPSTRPVELHIGNIPVVLCGIPSRELDATGLSISSSVPSLKETLTHESTWRISAVSTSRRLLFPMAAVKMTKSEII